MWDRHFAGDSMAFEGGGRGSGEGDDGEAVELEA